jgi:hypothetical protein
VAVSILAVNAAVADEYRSDQTPFTDFLFAAGEKLDCYFTLETWELWNDHPSCFKDVEIRDDKLASIDALVAKLKHEIPGITVTRDPANGRILHLIDGSLLKESHYVLEKQASIDFTGPLEDLPNELGKGMWWAVARSERAGCDFQNDIVSMVKVHFERQSIRQILTDAVPLRKYGRILWIAHTRRKNDGELTTDVTYVGPKLVKASGKNEGAVVEISIPAEFTLGRSMPTTVVIRNAGDTPFYCRETGPLPNDKMEMELTDRHTNRQVKMTEGGQRTVESVRRGGSGADVRVEKGKSIDWVAMNLAEFYAPPPGRYRLTVKLHFYRELGGHDLPVRVDPLDFVVAK